MFTEPTLRPAFSPFNSTQHYKANVSEPPRVAGGGKQTRSNAATMSKALHKLLCAAAVSRAFCQQLLTAPAQSLDSGYNGESFELNVQERALVLSVRAASLAEFANQLLEKLEQSSHHQENTAHHDAICRVASSGD